MPDRNDVLTIFCKSASGEAKPVFKKLAGKLSKQRIDEFRFLTISSRFFAPIGLNVDSLMKLLLSGCSIVRVPAFSVDVLIGSLMFLIFTSKKDADSLHLFCDMKSGADCAGGLVSSSTVAKSNQFLLIFLLILSEN